MDPGRLSRDTAGSLGVMNDRDAIAALTSDLHWQIDQLRVRGVKDKAGNPYNPSYYKRGLKNAVDAGGIAVADYVRRYLYKPPSEGYKKLEQADALDLACEALVADAGKPYASPLFTDPDRAAARARLAPYIAAIAARKAASQERIAARHAEPVRVRRRRPATARGRRRRSRRKRSPSTRRSWSTLPKISWR